MVLFTLLKTHPKKSLFTLVSATASFTYLRDVYSEEVSRRQFCNSIKPKGLELISPVGQLRRLTVFLNPFARHGSLLKEFDKNVAPMLQLSGLDVQMVYTDNDVETKDYVRVLDPQSTDGILVAGDDHVLQKVTTALLERPELSCGPRRMPVGVVPVGVWNTFCAATVNRQNPVNWCFAMLTPLLNGSVQTQNVLEITTIPTRTQSAESENDTNQSSSTMAATQRTAFSLSGLEWSIWRDVEHGGGVGAPKGKSKPVDPNDHRGLLNVFTPISLRAWTRRLGALWRYTWFWLKSKPEVNNSFILTAPDSLSGSKSSFFLINATDRMTESNELPVRHRVRSKYARLVYTPACDGCSKCWSDRIKHLQSTPNSGVVSAPRSISTFSRLFGLGQVAIPNGPKNSDGIRLDRLPEDRSHIENDECGREYTIDLKNTAGVIAALDGNNIRVDLVPTPKGFLSYIQQVFLWLSSDSYRHSLVDTSGEPQSTNVLRCSTLRLYPKITQNEFFWIDNNHFEACPVQLRVRINALDFYR